MRTAQKVNLDALPAVQSAVKSVEEKLAGRGRVLLRPSGTEPVVRVMVEGEDDGLVRSLCGELAHVVQRSVGCSRFPSLTTDGWVPLPALERGGNGRISATPDLA